MHYLCTEVLKMATKRVSNIIIYMLFPLLVMAQGWPENYGGVMLQGFYWDSYDDSNWYELEEQADELSEYFDLIWVPNSGYCNATSNQMGYLPIWWFNHLSAFGTEDELRSMIATFAEKGTGIIEDVVINHKAGNTNWCDFPEETWNGNTITWSLADICTGDDGGATAEAGYEVCGATDTGDDFYGGRDLDHTGENVQNNVKVYLDFLLNELGYVGFRYDMVKGYSAEYTGLYNSSANPTYSVGEYWDGTSSIKKWIDGTAVDGLIQSAAFDFPLKYNINDAFDDGSWSSLNTTTIASDTDYQRYAVTFIDNHDTYRTGEDGSDPLTSHIEAANAYLLMMPGTPCVFLPHWQAYKTAIKKFIFVRKAAGITNQSSITRGEVTSGGYALSVEGTNGSILLLTGGAVSTTHSGYKAAVSGTYYALYVDEDLDISGIDDIVEEEEEEFVAPSFCTYDDDELCAFFEAPTSWGDVQCWAWNSSKNFTGGTWPGVDCDYIGDTEKGRAVWKWSGGTLTSSVPTGIIFNTDSGSTQTADLDFTNAGYYTTGGLQGVVTSQISTVTADSDSPRDIKVYNLEGKLVRNIKQATYEEAVDGLGHGTFFIDGKKFIK